MAKADQTAVAECQVQPHPGQRQHRHLRCQSNHKRLIQDQCHKRYHQQRARERSVDPSEAAHAGASPNNPLGRQISTPAINT